jgi:hypothetical protein
VKLAYAGAALSVLLVGGWLVYTNIGINKDTLASNENQLPDFAWRKKISLAKDLVKGSETLLNFPLLVQLSDPDLKSIANGGKVIHPKGYDIRFTKADGRSIYPSQIDAYDPKKGEISAWVLMDTLSASNLQDLYVYYSNATIKAELPTILWSDSYRGIWHMNDLNAANSRKLRATVQGTGEATGKVGAARLFDAARKDAAFYAYAEELDMRSDFSLSAWVYLNETGREQVVLSNQGDRPGGYRLFISKDNKLSADYLNASGKRISLNEVSGGEKLEKGRWYYLAVSYSLKENMFQTFVDGLSDRSLASIDAPASSSSALQLGRELFNENTYFNGLLDEVRISSQARTAAWMATELYNQTLTKRLFSLGKAEYLQLDNAAVKRNKDGMNDQSAQQLDQQAKANTLHAKKVPDSGEAPSSLTSSAEALQAKMNDIRRVARDNWK